MKANVGPVDTSRGGLWHAWPRGKSVGFVNAPSGQRRNPDRDLRSPHATEYLKRFGAYPDHFAPARISTAAVIANVPYPQK